MLIVTTSLHNLKFSLYSKWLHMSKALKVGGWGLHPKPKLGMFLKFLFLNDISILEQIMKLYKELKNYI